MTTESEPEVEADDGSTEREQQSIELSGSTFYLREGDDGKELHTTRNAAIESLRESVNGQVPDADDISIVEVTVGGDDGRGQWEIKEVSGMQIALELLNGGEI